MTGWCVDTPNAWRTPTPSLHRLNVSKASGTVALSAEAMEERLRAQLERGELTLAKIRADHVRYCE